MHTVLKTHIIDMNELKLLSNRLSGRGDAYSIAGTKVTTRNLVVWSTQEPSTDCFWPKQPLL